MMCIFGVPRSDTDWRMFGAGQFWILRTEIIADFGLI
jgi:hypothetical protein